MVYRLAHVIPFQSLRPGNACRIFQANQVWLFLVQLAQNLLCWAKRLCFGPAFLLARPKRLRYQLLQVAGRLVHTGRRSILRPDDRWPWARELELAFSRLYSLPLSP
ncbi:MAG: transposase [Candidatus Dormibacteraeota bacterium]|nr:transposase [Candidatus Dormibacteraeota bacterium]